MSFSSATRIGLFGVGGCYPSNRRVGGGLPYPYVRNIKRVMGRRDQATDTAPAPGAAVRTLGDRSPSPWPPVAAAPDALVLPGGWQIEGLPATVRRAGPQAAERTVEFFTAQIHNPHTRAAYAAAVTRFFTWCDARGLELAQISPIAVATYIDDMHGRYSAPRSSSIWPPSPASSIGW